MAATTATRDLIQAITDNGGFTYDPTTGTLVEIGSTDAYAIARPGTERVVGDAAVTREAFVVTVADILNEHADEIAQGAVLGGWFSEDRGQYLVELTDLVRVPREIALTIGEARHQEGILHLGTGEYIPTGGHGDA